jgi:hypothetical protein
MKNYKEVLLMKLFDRKQKEKLKWTVIPGMIGTSEQIIEEKRKLDKELRKNKMTRYIRTQVQPLPCGMAQMLVWRGAI